MSDAPSRRRAYGWRDPRPAWDRLGKLDGLAYLEAERDGQLPPPPITVVNRFRLTEVRRGRVVYRGTPGEDHANAVGSVQGGWTASILDAALGSVVHSMLPAGRLYTTLEIKVNYVRAVRFDTGELAAIAEIRHAGRQTATAEAHLFDPDDRLLAHASTTCLVFEAD